MSPLNIRMRPELVVTPQGSDSERRWLVYDPVTLEYFRLRDEEWSILRRLDGRATLEDIRTSFEKQFAPLRLGAQQLQAFFYRLHEFGLIVGSTPGQGDVLCQRQQAIWRRIPRICRDDRAVILRFHAHQLNRCKASPDLRHPSAN